MASKRRYGLDATLVNDVKFNPEGTKYYFRSSFDENEGRKQHYFYMLQDDSLVQVNADLIPDYEDSLYDTNIAFSQNMRYFVTFVQKKDQTMMRTSLYKWEDDQIQLI